MIGTYECPIKENCNECPQVNEKECYGEKMQKALMAKERYERRGIFQNRLTKKG